MFLTFEQFNCTTCSEKWMLFSDGSKRTDFARVCVKADVANHRFECALRINHADIKKVLGG